MTGRPESRAMTPTVSDIRKAAQVHFRLTREQIQAANRSFAVSHPRQIAMTIAREMTRASMPQIASHFGNLDHTCILDGIARTFERTRRSEDAALDYTFVSRLARDFAKQRVERERGWVDRLHRGEVSWPSNQGAMP